MAQTEQKNQNVKKQFEELQSLLERAMALQTSMVLFEWDDETLAPKGAAEHTARVIGSLSEQYQEILASMRFKELLDACQKAEKENAGVFDEVQSAILREAAEEQERLSCIPPKVAPTQVMIVPIQQAKEGVLDKAFEVKEVLSNFRVKVDDSDKSPGWKFSESEMRGIPVRVEIGPRDIAENQAVLVRRDTHEKITVSLDEIAAKVGELLETIHHDMFERAKAHRDSHTYVATTLDEMKEIAENKPGFIKAMWCGNQECEDKLKEVVGVTSRCIPFNQEHLADTCVCCGKPATKMVYWGKAY